MEVAAKHCHAKISPQKARLVADTVRGLTAAKAIDELTHSTKKAAGLIKKVLESAIANAEHNHASDIDELNISKIFVDVGPVMKRFSARARGRSDRIIKRSCHITVMVSDGKGN